jgi:hypothetical protein
MLFVLLRIVGVIWLLGFILLAGIATSSYLFSSEPELTRTQRWLTRLRMSIIWPIALLSADGRARLRRG